MAIKSLKILLGSLRQVELLTVGLVSVDLVSAGVISVAMDPANDANLAKVILVHATDDKVVTGGVKPSSVKAAFYGRPFATIIFIEQVVAPIPSS